MRRRRVAAVEAVAGREVARRHDKARRRIDVKGAKQPGIDPERGRGVRALPDRRQGLLEPAAIMVSWFGLQRRKWQQGENND